ncbi:MAG: HflK protein [Treponema sp. CETP13]|nr:MAG: HflK protein [Treponema sp. CETP13]
MAPKQKKKFRATPALIILILVLIIAGLSIGTSFFTVDETEQAVITRFGKYYTTMGSGLHYKIPFGIDKSYMVPVKVVQTEQFGFSTYNNNSTKTSVKKESTMLTGDLNIIDVEWIIQYRIVDPAAWLFNVQERTQTIRDISQSVINTLVGDRAILNVMGSARSEIETEALATMNENFESLGLGINIIAVKLQNIVPPEGVQDSFEDVNRASQDMERYINEGKESYNSQIPLAQGEAEQTIQQAEGYATERVNEAKGDVARFNAVYQEYIKAPKVTRERIYLETMQEVYSAKDNQTLIDTQLENIIPVNNISTDSATSTATGAAAGSNSSTGGSN